MELFCTYRIVGKFVGKVVRITVWIILDKTIFTVKFVWLKIITHTHKVSEYGPWPLYQFVHNVRTDFDPTTCIWLCECPLQVYQFVHNVRSDFLPTIWLLRWVKKGPGQYVRSFTMLRVFPPDYMTIGWFNEDPAQYISSFTMLGVTSTQLCGCLNGFKQDPDQYIKSVTTLGVISTWLYNCLHASWPVYQFDHNVKSEFHPTIWLRRCPFVNMSVPSQF